MKITLTIELSRDEAAEKLSALAGLLGDDDAVAVAAEPRKRQARTRKVEASVPAAEAPVLTLVEPTPAAEAPVLTLVEPTPEPEAEAEPAAFEAIMSAQPLAVDPEVARDRVRTLMIDTLGITWARAHVLPHYGSLSAVPDGDLPGLLARAEADAAAMTAAEEAAAVTA